jgi:hypothetical protein
MTTSNFPKFSAAVERNWNAISKHEVFTTTVNGDVLYELYLKSFPEGTNPMFKERTEHDCSCCKNFIRNIGGLVAVVNGSVQTVWNGLFEAPYDAVAKELNSIVLAASLTGVYRTAMGTYGLASNKSLIDGKVCTFHHFVAKIPNTLISPEPYADMGKKSAIIQVVNRGLREITAEAIETTLSLIKQDAVYRGAEFLKAVEGFKELKAGWLAATDKKLFTFSNYKNRSAGLRNTVIGSLLVDLSEGMDVEKAVTRFEAKVAPENYKRTKAVVTPVMIRRALETIKELGVEESLQRRYARLEDLSVNDVLFSDVEDRSHLKGALESLLSDDLQKGAKTVQKGHQTIGIKEFEERVLPGASRIEVLVRNEDAKKLVSLTTAEHLDSPPLFQWGNSFSWSYSGEVTDSLVQRVKDKGGATEGLALHIPLGWSNADDLDLHCVGPMGHVSFGRKQGILDIDMNAQPSGKSFDNKAPVENLAFKRLPTGSYRIYVKQYNRRDTSDSGFTIQFRTPTEVKEFSCHQSPNTSRIQECFTFDVLKGEITNFKVGEGLKAGATTGRKHWGVTLGQFIPVSTITKSPNHWDTESGNLHWFFFLKGCQNPEGTRGIYNEFLRSDLLTHRKAFELIGERTKVQHSDRQLSGVGFSSTRRDTLTVKADGRDYTVTL